MGWAALGIVMAPTAPTAPSRSARARRPSMVAFALLAAGLTCLLLYGHVALANGWLDVDRAVPFMVRGFAAAVALGIGCVNVARYLGRRDASSLIVGVAFSGVGVLFVSRLALHAAAVIVDPSLFETTFRILWSMQLFLPVALILGIVLVPAARSDEGPGDTGEPMRRGSAIFVALASLLVIVALAGSWFPAFPGGTLDDTLVARPSAGWLVSAYLVVLVKVWRRHDLVGAPEGPWLVLALFVGFLNAALVAPFWHTVGVAAALLDAGSTLVMVLAAGMGTLVGMVRQARDEGALVDALRAESIERARIERALAHEAARLEQANDELAQYAYLASHDLQEPLRMVTNYLQLIERRYEHLLDDDGREFMGFAVDGAVRMKQLTNDLLAYSKVNAEPVVGKLTDGDVALRSAQANLALAIAEAGAEITHGALPSVPIDHVRLVQLLQNLVSNAIKFRREGVAPRIHVEAAREGETWRFTVRDNGIGIERPYFDKVFGVFQRLHRTDVYPGSGIGLAICKKIVERHGGAMWLESTPGVGTAVHWTVPVDVEAVRALRTRAPVERDDVGEHVDTLIERARELL